MQLSIIEFARNVLGLEDANSIRVWCSNTKNPLIYLIDQFINKKVEILNWETHESPMGGTMRLGEYPFKP